MVKWSREEFKQNILEAFDAKDVCSKDSDLNKFLDLNYDEDSSMRKWTYADFTLFALDVAENGFWKACKLNDFHTPNE